MKNTCVKEYTEHRGVLVEKYRVFWLCVFVIEENGAEIKINVGRRVYSEMNLGSRLTVGVIGRKLINIRSGFCENTDE